MTTTDAATAPEPEPEPTLPPFEKIQGEVYVDTTRPRPEDEGAAEATVTHLPVRQEVAADELLGSLIPAQDELRGVAQLAVTLALAGNVPKSLREKPADVLAVILTGRELGVGPMTAIRTFHVIEGSVTVSPKVRMAMVNKQGLGRLFEHQPPIVIGENDQGEPIYRLCPCGRNDSENDSERARWHAMRTDDPFHMVRTSVYTREMAGGVKTNSSGGTLLTKDNWKNYPERMLSWRALGYLIDDVFPEVGTGLYSPDEMGAVTDEDGEPILDVTATEALVPTSSSGRSGPPQEKAPNMTPASDAEKQALKERIQRIQTYEGANEALEVIWMNPQRDRNQAWHISPLGKLLQREVPVAMAAVGSVEKRIEKGEFGEPSLPPQQEGDGDGLGVPTDAPEAAENSAGSVSEPESGNDAPEPAEAQGAAQERPAVPFDVDRLLADAGERTSTNDFQWVMVAPDDVVARIAADVKAVPKDELASRLRAQDLPITGNEDTKRQRLSARLVRREMERMAGIPSL